MLAIICYSWNNGWVLYTSQLQLLFSLDLVVAIGLLLYAIKTSIEDTSHQLIHTSNSKSVNKVEFTND